MSSLILTGDTSGTITLAAPAVAGTHTLTMPVATGTAVLEDASGVLQMNSGYGSNAAAYGCRAWVNFNGTGTVAIRDSANVSSITDNAVGQFTVNITNAMPDVNCAPVCSGMRFAASVSRAGKIDANMASTTTVRLFTGYEDTLNGPIPTDLEFNHIAILR
mgnify:FL=1